MSDITPITTGATGIKPVPSFNLPIVLGAETIKRGLLNVRPRYMDKVELLKFKSSQDSFMAPVSTPTVTSGDYSITNRQNLQPLKRFRRAVRFSMGARSANKCYFIASSKEGSFGHISNGNRSKHRKANLGG